MNQPRHQTLKFLARLVISSCLIICLIGCEKIDDNQKISVDDYLKELASQSGISFEDNYKKDLNDWGISIPKDTSEELRFSYLRSSLSELLELNETELVKVLEIEQHKDNDVLAKEEVLKIIEKAVTYLNNPKINYSKENTEEQFENSWEIDFEDCEVIPYYGQSSSYKNLIYELLSASYAFYYNGYRISYNVSSSSIQVRISKKLKSGYNVYYDLALSSIKPTCKYSSKDDDQFFKISYNSVSRFGMNKGKYYNYAFSFNDVDKSNPKSFIDSIIKDKDEIEETFKICQIKTPIPDMPTVFFNIDLGINIYASGKIELALYDNRSVGFEVKNNKFRLINDSTYHDIDGIVNASAKGCFFTNFNIETASKRLMDLELDIGARAKAQTTVHYYDEDDNYLNSETLEGDIAAFEEASTNFDNIKICGDLSLYWLLDLKINTSKSVLGKVGFSKTFEFMDEDDQIFGNLHHIENGQFVQKCTRKYKKNINKTSTQELNVNKILLEKYSIVLSKGDKYQIEVSLPDGYNINNISLIPNKNEIVKIDGLTITALTPGSTKIQIITNDEKYEAYLNVLVSYE